MIGTRFAHYEITGHLGSGGMGDVYRAADSKLGRSVAVKFLPDPFARDTWRVSRFQREARVLASLNHPNIGGIHGIEDIDGRMFLVLELVAGETLADRIARGPIPIDEALAIANQIAEALEAAHDVGIVHRDLKPANVKITPDGQVKVLDFGLAKALDGGEIESAASSSPTMSLAATQRGLILGTAGYMSPEQARGKPTDRRTDIWSFGVVLYEMTTGERLFKGEDMTDTLAAVVREKPDFSAAPREIQHVLQKCLERDVKKRLRHISGFKLLLERAETERVPLPAKSRLRWLSWTVAALATTALIALAFVHLSEQPPPLAGVQFFLDAPPDTAFTNNYGGLAPSPNGRYLVFSARSLSGTAPQLWLRPLDSLSARPLAGSEGGNFPTWSPDNKSILFLSGGKIKRIEIAGGAPLAVADASESSVTVTGTWNSDGVILIGSSAGLRRIAASGEDTLLTKIDATRRETGHGYPQFLPDGKRFLFFIASGDPGIQGVYSASLDHPGEHKLIVRTSAKGVFVPGNHNFPDYLLWMQDQTLLAQRFNTRTARVEGDPASVAENVGTNPSNPIRSAYWASDAGLLIYFSTAAAAKRRILMLARDGKQVLEVPEDSFMRVALAPGSEQIAVAKADYSAPQGNIDVWVREFSRGVMTRLTFDAGNDDFPIWSPDGKQLAFVSNRDGTSQIYIKDASGAGKEERLTSSPGLKFVLDWSKDGKYILYREQNPGTGRDLMAIPVMPTNGERKPITVVQTPFAESTGALSPDGQWIAYASNDSGTNEIFVQSFPGTPGGPSGRWQVSSGGGYDVKWRGDSREIYYESLDGKMVAVEVQGSPQGIRAQQRRELFSTNFTRNSLREFDVTPDGQRFLLIANPRAESADHLTVVSNWQAALRK